MNCEICGIRIPIERLEAVPGTVRCVKHSDASKCLCLMDYSHKTAPSLVVIDSRDKEAVRLARRAFNRSR